MLLGHFLKAIGFAALHQIGTKRGRLKKITVKCIAWVWEWHILTHYYDTAKDPKQEKRFESITRPWKTILRVYVRYFYCFSYVDFPCETAWFSTVWKYFAFSFCFWDILLGQWGITLTSVGCRIAFSDQNCKICISTHTMNTPFECFETVGDTAYASTVSEVKH